MASKIKAQLHEKTRQKKGIAIFALVTPILSTLTTKKSEISQTRPSWEKTTQKKKKKHTLCISQKFEVEEIWADTKMIMNEK